jgi:F-type H+-transporting ATPase subunit gamma
MATLSALRQRIKSVETIKKTTNAMRLISMSLHSRLRSQKFYLESYKKEVSDLLACAQASLQNSVTPKKIHDNQHGKQLLIVVGSQKGLAGTFNQNLSNFFLIDLEKSNRESQEIIIIGKHMIDHLGSKGVTADKLYSNFSNANFVRIAQEITNKLLDSGKYQSTVIYTTTTLTFFSQKQIRVPLLPLSFQQPCLAKINYSFEQPAQDIVSYLTRLYIQLTLQEALFESLLAEQAIRFLSMDAATQNADRLLNSMKLDYNKLRQASITRELTDLASSLS